MKSKIRLVFLVFFVFSIVPMVVNSEEQRTRVVVRANSEKTLTQVFVYLDRSLKISYGYFSSAHHESNGTPFATALLFEENTDIFIRLDENNLIVYFTIFDYYSERLDVFNCSEERRRCDEMQARWNEINARYRLHQRVRVIPRR